MNDLIIGRKEIVAVFEPMYHIGTWMGARKFIRQHDIPLWRNPAGKPVLLRHELDQCNARIQKLAQKRREPKPPP